MRHGGTRITRRGARAASTCSLFGYFLKYGSDVRSRCGVVRSPERQSIGESVIITSEHMLNLQERLFLHQLLIAATALATNLVRTVFSPPVLITDGANPNWMTGYADGGVRLDDENLFWQTTPGRDSAEQYGAPVYRSTDRGSSWHAEYVGDVTFIVSPIPATAAGGGALRGWGQLAGDPCSSNGTHNQPPDDLTKTWSDLTSASCWQTPCSRPRVFGVDAATGSFFVRNLTGGSLTIDLAPHRIWCYNQTMRAPATVMSVSGNTGLLQDGSIVQTLNLFWGGPWQITARHARRRRLAGASRGNPMILIGPGCLGPMCAFVL